MKLTTEDKIEQFHGEALIEGSDLVVLVEDGEDEAFWRMLLESYLPDKKPFFPYWELNGKDGLLKNFGSKVSDKMVVCVDADNETVITSKHSKFLSPRQPFIFHTHTHSRENHLLYPRNLTTECYELTQTRHDFEADIAAIAKAVRPWLMLWLYCRDENQGWLEDEISDLPQKIAWSILKDIARKAHTDAELQGTLADWREKFFGAIAAGVKENVEATYEFFEANGHGNLKEEITAFSQICTVSAEESLFFIQGHIAFDAMIEPYFDKVVRFLTLEQELAENSHDRKKHWRNVANKPLRDILSRSYRLCLIPPRSCQFLENVKADIVGDFKLHD